MRLRKLDNTERSAVRAAIGRKAYAGVHKDDIVSDIASYLRMKGWDNADAVRRARLEADKLSR